MASPSSAISRLDRSMTYAEFALRANQMKMIGLQVLPPIGVAQEAASFAKIPVEDLLTKVEDTERAPYATYNRADWEWTTDSYDCKEHGVEEIADDATIERYGDVVRVEQIAVARAINRIIQRLEYDIAAAVINTTTWTGASLTTAITTSWKAANRATADPIKDIDAARESVKSSCGMAPNTIVMTDSDFINCIRTTRVEDLLKYDAVEVLFAMQGGRNTAIVNAAAAALASIFQVERVLVGQSFQNTAIEGQDASFSRFWTAGSVMVCRTNDDGMSGDLEAVDPCIGRTVFSTKNNEPLPGSNEPGFGSLLMDEYREENVRGSVFRPRNKRHVKIIHKECGHLLTGAAT